MHTVDKTDVRKMSWLEELFPEVRKWGSVVSLHKSYSLFRGMPK